MKHVLATLVLFPCFTAVNAQLVNGSFEENGAFTLTGWEWSCDNPQPMMDVPPGGGLWSAWKEAGHTKLCFPSYLYQRISNVLNGQPMQLTGWVKCPLGEFDDCQGGTIGFGVINGGVFTLGPTTTSTDPDWTFLAVEHAFDTGTGDTAIVVLNAGLGFGPFNPIPAGFDQLTLESPEGISDHVAPMLSLFPDPVIDVLHVGSDHRILGISIVDLKGGVILNVRGNATTEHLGVGSLPKGEYVLRVTTEKGEATERFVKR